MTLYQNSNETGRSLVEMLGVLAIIGVLSVGGIAGYTVAMNKHRANTLLDAASKRAIVVATQVSAGKSANIGEFKDPEGYEFDVETEGLTNQFKITIDSVNKAVCEKMQDMVSGNATIQAFAPETCADGVIVGLTYNNDMGSGATTEDSDTCTLSCSEGLQESKCACNVDSDCTDWEQNVCGEGMYCDFSNATGCGTDKLSPNQPGTCKSIGTGITGGCGGHKCKSAMNWWSANSWCVAQNTGGLFEFGGTIGETTVADDGYYANGPGPLYQAGLNGTYWISEDAGSCHAYTVDVSGNDEYVGDGYRYDNYRYALCR